MTTPVMSCSSEIMQRLLQAEKFFLMLDYDGTLADFAPNPDVVMPDLELIDLLSRLSLQPRILLAVVSGRKLEHLQSLVPLPGIWLAGSYGLELISPQGERIERLDFLSVQGWMAEIKPSLQNLIEGKHGFYLEDKGWSLALHARFADNLEAGQTFSAVRNFLAPIVNQSDFQILGGHKFLEVAPLLADKGATIDYLFRVEKFENGRSVFIGDDDKDEKAFYAIKKKGGDAIVVSYHARPTCADCRFRTTQDVRKWLAELC